MDKGTNYQSHLSKSFFSWNKLIVMNILHYKSKYNIFNWLPFFLATWSWMDHWVLESFIFCSKSFSWSIHEQKYLKYLMLTITWTQRENNGQLYHIPITCQISSHNFLYQIEMMAELINTPPPNSYTSLS